MDSANHLVHLPVHLGGVTMDSVFHPLNVVMGTGSVLMAVMNSTAVSIDLLVSHVHALHVQILCLVIHIPSQHHVPILSGSV